MGNSVGMTGTTGFVGLNLVPYIKERGCQVFGISRRPKQGEIAYSELSEAYWGQIDSFVHLAGKAHDLKKVSSEDEYFVVNRDLTIQLFDAFLKSTCRTFIYISSVKAVRDSIDEVLVEATEAFPTTPYGRSKLAAENYIRSCTIPKSKKVYILRPCMIHGPYNKGNLNVLYNFINKGIPYPLGVYKNERSFLSIENLLYVINSLISENKVASGTYNVADDQAMSTNKLVMLIADVLKINSRILYMPKIIIKLLAKIGDLVPVIPLNTERIEKLTENYRVSNMKIKKALGIEQMPVAAAEGMKKTIQSFV